MPRRSNPFGTLPPAGVRQWDAVYEAALADGASKSSAAKRAWGVVKQSYYKRGDRWVRRKSNPEASPGCVLAKHAWDRSAAECGDDPDEPREAAQKLARKRWKLPAELAKTKAKLLR